MKAVKVEWICSEERDIPGYGTMTKGRKLEMDEHIATSLVKQGLMSFIKAKSVKPKTEEDS